MHFSTTEETVAAMPELDGAIFVSDDLKNSTEQSLETWCRTFWHQFKDLLNESKT